jgi:hypothetical protein
LQLRRFAVLCSQHSEQQRLYPVFKYAFLIALALPAVASAADYVVESNDKPRCPTEQTGQVYCVISPPLEKLVSDCEPGKDCHHMESGQHYSLQKPVVAN